MAGAIGHSGGAYATTEPSRVDFGEIALNAQKFQDAELERRKDLLAKAKPQPFEKADMQKFDPASVTDATINGNYNRMITDFANEVNTLETIRKERDLTNEERTRYQNAMNGAKTLKEKSTVINEGLKNIPALVTNSSIVSDEVTNAYKYLTTGEGIFAKPNQSMDDIDIYVYERDKDGKLIKEDNDFGGFKVYTYQNDDGSEEPLVIKGNDIANGKFQEMFYQRNDLLNGLPKKYSETVGLKTTLNENGDVTISTKELTPQAFERLKKNIKTDVFSSNKKVADILSQTASYRGEDPMLYAKIPKGGFSDEQKQLATDIMIDRTKERFDTSYSYTVDEPKEDRSVNVNVGGSKPVPQLSKVLNRIEETVTGKDGKKTKKTVAYEVPFLQSNNSMTYKGMNITPKGVGKDKNGYYISYEETISDSKTFKTQGASKTTSEKNLKHGKIYIGGDKSKETDVLNILSNIANTDGIKIQNNREATDYVEKLMKDRGVSIGGSDNDNKPKTQEEWNKNWSKLKKGQKMVGLDGKTYTKN